MVWLGEKAFSCMPKPTQANDPTENRTAASKKSKVFAKTLNKVEVLN